MKHPALRVAAWHWIVPDYQRLIADAILTVAVPTLPFRPMRVEIVGSLARGCAALHSDIDLNLAAADWNEQVRWRRLWADRAHRVRFQNALDPLREALGIEIDAHPNNPDQYEYDIGYDLLADAFSDPLRRFPDHTGRSWDRVQLKWLVVPMFQPKLVPDSDPWPTSEVDRWKRIYGDRFLDARKCESPSIQREPIGLTVPTL